MRKLDRFDFQKMTRLYHFTSLESACKIISSGHLRFGKYSNQNDLIETNRVVWERTLSPDIVENDDNLIYAEKEMRRYQQISFAQDRVCDGVEYLGFDLHTMWGLYADKGYGVCLVFDKSKLKLSPGDYAADVHYANLIPQGIIIRNTTKEEIKEEIWHRKDEIFFYKRKEWEKEQEFRIVRRVRDEQDMEFLDISEALSFVIICKDRSVGFLDSMFDSPTYRKMRRFKKSLPVFTYEYDLDWYTLFEDFMVPVWTEQCGFM